MAKILSVRNDRNDSKDDINNNTSGIDGESMDLSRIPGNAELTSGSFHLHQLEDTER